MKIYLVLAGAVALIGLGLFLMEIGRDSRPPVPCSLVVHWDNPQDRDRCLARESTAK